MIYTVSRNSPVIYSNIQVIHSYPIAIVTLTINPFIVAAVCIVIVILVQKELFDTIDGHRYPYD